MYKYFRKDVILRFYHYLGKVDFTSITSDRRKELDKIVAKHTYYFQTQSAGFLTLMTFVAERLTISYKTYGLLTKSEAAYFYINIIDPNLLFLEIYEAANMVQERRNYSFLNFGIYDQHLMYLEKMYNNYFLDYNPDDLWSREKIKR